MKRLRRQDSMDPVKAHMLHSQGLGSRHDVFLSCRGEDTRASFTSHLYSYLRNAGIYVFEDDSEHSRGNDISIEVLRSIEGSRISIIIFSRNYANSRWCLEVLSKIMEVHRAYGQVVLPVFFYLKPSEVRNQIESFGEAFQDLLQRISPSEIEVSKWKTALREAAGIAGYDLLNAKNEGKIIEKIVEDVRIKLHKKGLFVTNHPVGLNSRAQEVISVLKNHDSKEVILVGIWGTGGIGKTTIAIAIYKEIGPMFESRCFLSNITEIWKQDDGPVTLQNRLLLEICKTTEMTINKVELGKIILKDQLRHKKALVVLDNVDTLDQLDALSVSREWFGQGSRIIIITRDLGLLKDIRVDHEYEMKSMNHSESVERLSGHALQSSSIEEFIELSRSIDAYSGGLPPVLNKVFGSDLFDKVIEWKNSLNKVKRIPNDEITKKLKVIFDCLADDLKKIFLPIALFFIGEDRNDVTQILNGHGFSADIGIRELVKRRMIAIDENNKLVMDDLLWNVGRDIIHERSRKELGEQGHKYDVFLTFRGEDTRSSFTSHLYSYLSNVGIIVYKDDAEVSRGNHISAELLGGIASSKIFIIIFSREYAGSRWCLVELSKIMELHKSNGQVVLPIFYDVNPSEICDQTSGFGKAFNDLIHRISPSKDQVSKWRTALCEAGGIEGFVVLGSRNENEDIKTIVERVCNILDKKDIFVTNHPVGVNCREQDVVQISESGQSKDVEKHPVVGVNSQVQDVIQTRNLHLLNPSSQRCNVFLSFTSRDPQATTFTSRLYLSLNIDAGINVFKNNAEYPSIELLRAIENSKISIIIFSREYAGSTWCLEELLIIMELRKYAGSTWCLEELLIIMELRKSNGQVVLPVFYGVDPSEICHQTSSFGDAFDDLIRRISPPKDQFFKWRTALCEAGGIEGFVVLGSRSETEDIKNIVDHVCTILDKRDLLVVNHPVGVNCREQDAVEISKSYQSKDVVENHPFVRVNSQVQDVVQTRNLRLLEASSVDHVYEIKSDMSPDKISSSQRCDVFLSFRGEDTQVSFTSHLYASLVNAGIIVFKDDATLPRGNCISNELLKEIESSKVSIIIFSREYAGSKWCLKELSKIMELFKTNSQVVLPVFYDVDPSEIRHQTSSFGEAFEHLIHRISPTEDQVLKWRAALHEAGSMAGYVVLGSRSESEDIKNIVEHVCKTLDKKDLFIADHPIGVNSRVQDLIQFSESYLSTDVVLVGIWGMGGIGKTTIAKATYNEIGHMFEGRCFLSNIREVWKQEHGPVHLQNQLLFEICRTTNMKIHGDIELGKMILRDRLCRKKVLVVLDDVDKLDQLNALVGSREWFGPGSKIIITTRDEHLLKVLKVDLVHRMETMDESESFELFSWHAFKQPIPREGFMELSRNVVAYSGGLPLVLEVLGSYLFDREVIVWESVLEKLKRIPNYMIQNKLRISFDSLNDDIEKQIFLDISCFFIGMDRNNVTQILNACGYFAEIGISVLVERGLVTIDEKNKLGMHDLLRDMGREIIREQSPKVLGEQSRLWFHDDVVDVLSKHSGTKAVEGLALKLPRTQNLYFETKAFKKMKRLRLLHLENVQLQGDYEYISRDLKWLYWHGFPLKCIPDNFYQKNLVAIDLKYSSLRQVWKKPQLLKRLKILNLSHSPYLVQTPDFSKLPNLEKLILKDCQSLSMIHHTIGLLDKLLILNLKDCISLRRLPRSIYKLKSLRTLILSGCSKLEKLEEDIGQMDSLATLIANNSAITQVPFSMVRLKSIGYISLCGYEGLSRDVFPSLIWSWMSPMNNPLLRIPTYPDMSSSILLDMPNRSIPGDPSSIPSNLPKQQSLLLEGGLEFQTQKNRGVKKMLDSSNAINCMDKTRLENRWRHLLIQIGETDQVINTLTESISQGLTVIKNGDDCDLPYDKHPYWLTFKGEEDSVKFKVPSANGVNLKGITLCCIYLPSGGSGNMALDYFISLMIINYTKATKLHYKRDTVTSFEQSEWKQEIISNLDSDDQVEVTAIFGNGFTVKKTAVYLIYDDSFEEQIEDPSSPNGKVLPCIKQMKGGSCMVTGREARGGLNSLEWQRPTNGFIKVNVDGSCRTSNGQVGCGGVLRNGSGEFELGFLFNAGMGNCFNPEIWACVLGLKVAWDCGARRIILETGSSEAIRDVQLQGTLKHLNHDLIEEFRRMLERQWEVCIQHCSHKANSAAKYMARWALDAMPGLQICSSPPRELQRIVTREVERTRAGRAQSYSG